MSEQDKLALQNKPVFGKKVGLAAKLETAKNTVPEAFDPLSKKERLGLVIDDSGSMGTEGMEKAHEAIDLFVKNCNSLDTALAIYPLNAAPKSLTNNFAEIAIYAQTLLATGGTPLFSKLADLIKLEKITRAIAFSDGKPTDIYNETAALTNYLELKIPIDTIYIGCDYGMDTMKRIAEKTGGIFLHFTNASVLAKSLKYLTPRFRYMLSDKSIKEQVEKGAL